MKSERLSHSSQPEGAFTCFCE